MFWDLKQELHIYSLLSSQTPALFCLIIKVFREHKATLFVKAGDLNNQCTSSVGLHHEDLKNVSCSRSINGTLWYGGKSGITQVSAKRGLLRPLFGLRCLSYHISTIPCDYHLLKQNIEISSPSAIDSGGSAPYREVTPHFRNYTSGPGRLQQGIFSLETKVTEIGQK